MENIHLARSKNSWRRPWSKWRKIIIMHFTSNIYMYVILPFSLNSYMRVRTRDTCSLQYQLWTQDAHKKTTYVYAYFCQKWTKGHLIQTMEWIGVLKEAKKFPKWGFSNSQFDNWLHKATFWHQISMLHFWKLVSFLSRIITQWNLQV
jgi:hypothetical protein